MQRGQRKRYTSSYFSCRAGHKSGRHILEILGKGDKLEEDDYAHMKQVNAYCARHLKQGNSRDPEHSKWRYSLMNWCACRLNQVTCGELVCIVLALYATGCRSQASHLTVMLPAKWLASAGTCAWLG